MAQAAERFYAAVREEKLHHPRDDVLTRHVLNAHRKATDDGRWRFVKENKQSKKHIDALIAAAMVHNVAVDETLVSAAADGRMGLMRKVLAAGATLAGAGLLVAGVWMIFVPAAFIVAGVLLAAAGLLPDWGT